MSEMKYSLSCFYTSQDLSCNNTIVFCMQKGSAGNWHHVYKLHTILNHNLKGSTIWFCTSTARWII